MFDFESDQVDPRYAPPDEGKPTTNRPKNSEPTSQTTRRSNSPVIIPEPKIPKPPSPPTYTATPRRSAQRRNRSPLRSNDWALVVIGVALLLVVIVVGATFVTISSTPSSNGELTVVSADDILPTPVDARSRYEPRLLNPGERLTLDDGSSIIIQPWNGASRLNVLVMGLDRRPGESGLGYRTDTMMLVSFNPQTQQLGILSIPRDLFVQIPGYSARQRINTALSLGELQRPGYGPTLAMQTVQLNLGIGVNAFVIADFTALMTVIDSIGGIEVDVPYAINDYQFPDMNYGYDPLVLNAGLQHMDGYTAQKYARTRHGDSDFDRAARQQQVLFAMRDRVLSLDALPQLIIQAPTLYNSISQNVYTGFSLEEIIQLGLWLKDMPAGNIHTGVMDQRYVSDFMTPAGEQVLMPIPAALPSLMAEVFGEDYAR